MKKIVFIPHYYPPVNSSGAKRVEAISKYLASDGHDVTVITTKKTGADGEFTEAIPKGVRLIELDGLGRRSTSVQSNVLFEPMYTGRPSLKRRFKDWFQGEFAKEFIGENQAGNANFDRMRQEGKDHKVEIVGKELRDMMPWINQEF